MAHTKAYSEVSAVHNKLSHKNFHMISNITLVLMRKK